MSLATIKSPITAEMSAFEPYFKRQLKSPNRILSVITNYVLRRQGKQMRPMLVFLSAKATGNVGESTYAAASLIELLHTATLVHDDVVDDTFQRRGQFSVNALWNSKIAVLVGDYFLARGMQVALDGDYFDVLKIVSKAVQEISEGELVQIEHARKLDITEETYYEMIRKKTATLIAACTSAGAYSSGADEATVKTMYDFGMNLGIAFQIRDDIFDYEKSDLLGKPSGNDIKERKLTLPIIHALSQAPMTERCAMKRKIAHHYKADKTVVEATKFVVRHGGIDYARTKMLEFSNKAKEILGALPNSEAKNSLLQLVDFNIERRK